MDWRGQGLSRFGGRRKGYAAFARGCSSSRSCLKRSDSRRLRRIFDTGERYEELHRWFAEEWKRGEAAWPADVRAVFDELGLSSGLRRSLLESERFRQLLLEEQPLAKAA